MDENHKIYPNALQYVFYHCVSICVVNNLIVIFHATMSNESTVSKVYAQHISLTTNIIC